MSQNTRLPNRILRRLPETDYQLLLTLIEPVTLSIHEVVAQAGAAPKYVHFPISAVLSSMVVLEDGSTVEACTIGNEGMDGLHVLAEPLPNRYEITVQAAGQVLRISVAAFKKFLTESSAMSQLLMRYAVVLIQRGMQNAACIQHHTIEERMSRWLLEAADHNGQFKFHMTQEFLSDMLGVRRQSVNFTARLLQEANLITYHRGELAIIDRPGLVETSCECFGVMNEMYERWMRLDVV